MSTNCPTRTFAHNLTDEELDEHVKGILRLFPNSGYRRVLRQLESMNIHIQHARVRESMIKTDPEGVAVRCVRTCSPAKIQCFWSKCLMAYRWEPQVNKEVMIFALFCIFTQTCMLWIYMGLNHLTPLISIRDCIYYLSASRN